MSIIMQKFKIFVTKYPITRGMISYSIIWPTSSLIQQTFEGKRWGNYDWWRVLRFSLYGGLFVAPTIYGWFKISSAMWPQTSFKTAVMKAAVETISYTPFAMTCFYFFMSLLELKTIEEAAAEVGKKFLPTYKIGASIWPIVATINFSLIPERNRVPFISVCSLIWTCFLAYMKHLEHHQIDDENGVVLGAVITFIGYFFMMMSFCSPYWIESYEETRSNFKNMGLWQYCFKDYTYPNFQFQRKFTGCHNIFSQEYYVIREWLLPGWLMSVQAFVTLSFLLIFIVLTILALTIIRLPLKAVLQYEWLLIRISYLCTAVSSLFMFLAVCIFGGCAYRRDWLMYPKFNVLGWSYALAVVTFILLGLAALILHREAREAFDMRGEQKNLVMQMEMQEPGYQAPRHHHSQSRSLHGYI